MKKVLVVIDPQNDFISGTMKNINGENILNGIIEEMKKEEYSDIFISKDCHYEDHYNESIEGQRQPILHCDMYSKGWNFPDEMKTAINDLTDKIHKIEKGQFGYTFWDLDVPEDANEICICGYMLETNILSNAIILRSMFPNVKISILTDITTGINPKEITESLLIMKNCLIDIL